MKDKYLLVDINNFAFRWFTSRKSADLIANDMQNNIESFASSLFCNRIIICQDYKGSKYRKDLYPEYKANRKKKKKEEQQKMEEFFKKLSTITKILNIHYPLLKFEGVEADDVIFYLTQQLPKCTILSGDADLLQCGVEQFSFTKSKHITLEEQGFEDINSFIQAKAIAGDNSDNIKGLERVGLKTVIKYFKKYGVSTFADLRAAIPTNTKSKIEQRILNGEEIVARNLQLVDISLAQPYIITDNIKEEIHEAVNEFYN